MRASWMYPTETTCSVEELRSEGIGIETFAPEAAMGVAQSIQTQRGWSKIDDVQLSAVNPKDEAAIAREFDEHAHLADEVRLLLEGEGVYDVRAKDERWLRIWVAPGDLIVIPAKRYHRFIPGAYVSLRYVQVYPDRAVLLPLYRVSNDETRVG